MIIEGEESKIGSTSESGVEGRIPVSVQQSSCRVRTWGSVCRTTTNSKVCFNTIIMAGWGCPFFLSLQGCVCYIFASLFCISKREHLGNKEKCFLFHFESYSRSWDNQILTFYFIQISWRHQMPKHETWNILLSNLESKHNLVMKFGQYMQYHKIIFLSKNSTKYVAWKLVPGPF